MSCHFFCFCFIIIFHIDIDFTRPDVASQSTAPGWNLGKWADYVELEPSKREKILNVISLEISGTELANMILPPKIVRDLDWVENFWPSTRKGKNNAYPKVQLYCLMGVAGAWTVCLSLILHKQLGADRYLGLAY